MTPPLEVDPTELVGTQQIMLLDLNHTTLKCLDLWANDCVALTTCARVNKAQTCFYCKPYFAQVLKLVHQSPKSTDQSQIPNMVGDTRDD